MLEKQYRKSLEKDIKLTMKQLNILENWKVLYQI